MKRLAIIILVVLLCGASIFTSVYGTPPESDEEALEMIHYADISGVYLFVQNLSETRRMSSSLRDYLGDGSIQIQTSVPEGTVSYAESIWDPAKAVELSGGPVYCVEVWDIYKNGAFQKTTYLAGRV